MKLVKKTTAVLLAVMLLAFSLAGCSAAGDETYSDETLIIGYTEAAAPFLEVNEKGEATGFEADLWEAIFNDVKGDLKSYTFEKVEEGYALEDDGGLFDADGKEYSAALLMGAVTKNTGTFNEDYSFTEPIISNRIIAVTKKDSNVKSYADFAGARAVTSGETAQSVFEKNTAVSSACESVTAQEDITAALAMLDTGKADVVITDEFRFEPLENKDDYAVPDGELDTIEYVIACAKYSGWKDSINEAIRELKSEDYNDGDSFTPLVEQYFGYNASSFQYEGKGVK